MKHAWWRDNGYEMTDPATDRAKAISGVRTVPLRSVWTPSLPVKIRGCR